MTGFSLTTEEEVTLFMDGLRDSLIKGIRNGTPCCAETTVDTDPVTGYDDEYSMVPIDHIYRGGTWQIFFGRPAQAKRAAFRLSYEEVRAKLAESLP